MLAPVSIVSLLKCAARRPPQETSPPSYIDCMGGSVASEAELDAVTQHTHIMYDRPLQFSIGRRLKCSLLVDKWGERGRKCSRSQDRISGGSVLFLKKGSPAIASCVHQS